MFGGDCMPARNILYGWSTNKDKHAFWEFVAAAMSKVGQKDRIAADIEKKLYGN